MNPKDSSEITVQTLLAFRQESDALRVITEKLRVKEMGPADHIRTKHEVKAFVESGEAKLAEELLKNAHMRRAEHQNITQKMTHQHGQQMTQ